jgi:demethylmenaquinone methyltransferase/2-methoxy-6-polyprenyl-1,4-benzoquinol methylase
LPKEANFSNIYKVYDLVNTVLTLGFDKSWRIKASKYIIGNNVLDLGSGTGAAYKQLENFNVIALDPDEKMLQLNKFSKKITANAENIPLDDNSIDTVYCAFVWRNVNDTQKALSEVKRVLRPNGVFILLDMTRPKNKILRVIHRIGTLITTTLIGFLTLNIRDYRFLHTSLDKYEQPEVNFKQHPFNSIEIKRMGLFGFVYLTIFKK